MEIRQMKIRYYHAVRHYDVRKNIKTMKKMFSTVSNLQTHYHFQIYFLKVDQHTGDKWLIHGIKRHKGNQLQRLELPRSIS